MEKSASHDEKNESCRLPASLMLRTLKNTKSKLKYMKLSESVNRKKKKKGNHKSLVKVCSFFVSFKN